MSSMALDLSKHVARVLVVVYCDILALLSLFSKTTCTAYSPRTLSISAYYCFTSMCAAVLPDHVAMEVIQTSARGFPETLLAIYCVNQSDGIFKEASNWVMQSLPDMNITFCNRTEYKTTEIAGQLALLGAPWAWDAAWHSVLCLSLIHI